MKAVQVISALVEKLDATITVGYPLRMGVEHRVSLPGRGIFFRAFIPESDYPVELDLFSEGDRVCKDEEDLKKEINQYIDIMGS